LGDSLAALGEPEFRKLFIGQATSVVGSMFRVVALPFAVLAIGGTATDIGIVEAAGLIPLAVLVLLGGVWADRLPRRTVMLAADLGRTLLQLAAATLLVAGVAHVWHLAVLQVGMGVCEAFFGPAYTGLVPEVVSPPRLQQANALQGLVSSGSITLGAFLAGMLVAAVGPGWAIGIDGLSYLASTWFLLRLRPPAFLGRPGGKPVPAGGRAFFRDLADGWREFTSHTWIWVMVAGAALFLFAIEIAGGLLSLRWRPRRPMLVIAAGMSLTALPVAFLALEAPVWTLYASLAAVGVEWGLYDPFWLTCMQREVAPSMISRVSAYDYLGVLAFYPAGLALAGPLADAFGRSTVLWVSAGVAIFVSVFQLAWRDVRAPHAMGPAAEPAAPPAA
jgi:MFS family permease